MVGALKVAYIGGVLRWGYLSRETLGVLKLRQA
jgi:hypothetical protein